MEKLKTLSRGMLGSLSLQYILGMTINMFGVTPDDPKFATESPLVKVAFIVHSLNGLILPIFALITLYVSYKSKNQTFKKLTIYGFISVLFAAIGGISTITLKDTASEFASLLMATAFLFAFFFYIKFFLEVRK